jgi:pimeloyl-ACP methyl ester carboxylesterase
VVCLPGLARTCADFETLASALAGSAETPRHVIALDYRGRGRSDYDKNPANYNVSVELADILAVLTALDIPPAVFIGTSRGGILTMLLATARPTAIAGAILNDIGPVIETQGLLRIKNYVGNLPRPKTMEEGAEIMRRLFGPQFPNLGAEDWAAYARRTFKERRGRIAPSYDVKLAKTLQGIELHRPLPALWKEFDALVHVPVLVVRGANSDILSAETIVSMSSRRRGMEVIEVADQGHAPLLADGEIIRKIDSFVARCEAAGRALSEQSRSAV